MDPWLIWALAGLLLLGAELVLPGAFLLWAGLAAMGTGLLGRLAAPGFPVSVVAFVALLAAGVGIALRGRGQRSGTGLNTPESGLVGRDGVVLPHSGSDLRVRIGDGDWSARSEGPVLCPGEAVRVVAVDGTVLKVCSKG